MLKLLSKIFIKDYKNYSDCKVREKYGVLCGAYGIFLNILLFIAKFIAGTISLSVAMVADAFNNLSDAGSSVIQILGFKIASIKPDPKHPFGHGRVEYISGLVISFLVLLMGVELLKSSIGSIIHPEVVTASTVSIIILCVAVIIKFYMMAYNNSIAKKINSVAMKATATDSMFDAISTLLVLISVIVAKFTTFPVDGVAGVVVSGFILYGGFCSAMETVSPLLGTCPSKEFVNEVEEELLKHKPIVGMHDIAVHDYGPGRCMISLHAEVPGDGDIFELHDVIDVAEVDISKRFNCNTVIHMDPVDLKNERLSKLKVLVKEELAKINPELKAHDIRMVPGNTHTNLIFDVVKNINYKGSDEDLQKTISDAICSRPECKDICCVITIDQPYVD